MTKRIDMKNALTPEQLELFKNIVGHEIPNGYELVFKDGYWMVLRPPYFEGEPDGQRTLLAPENESLFNVPQEAEHLIRDNGLERIIMVEKPEASQELVANAIKSLIK